MCVMAVPSNGRRAYLFVLTSMNTVCSICLIGISLTVPDSAESEIHLSLGSFEVLLAKKKMGRLSELPA